MTNPVVNALQCVCLLTFSMLGRHVSTQHVVIFSYSPRNSLWLFMQIYIAYFLGKNKKTYHHFIVCCICAESAKPDVGCHNLSVIM